MAPAPAPSARPPRPPHNPSLPPQLGLCLLTPSRGACPARTPGPATPPRRPGEPPPPGSGKSPPPRRKPSRWEGCKPQVLCLPQGADSTQNHSRDGVKEACAPAVMTQHTRAPGSGPAAGATAERPGAVWTRLQRGLHTPLSPPSSAAQDKACASDLGLMAHCAPQPAHEHKGEGSDAPPGTEASPNHQAPCPGASCPTVSREQEGEPSHTGAGRTERV